MAVIKNLRANSERGVGRPRPKSTRFRFTLTIETFVYSINLSLYDIDWITLIKLIQVRFVQRGKFQIGRNPK